MRSAETIFVGRRDDEEAEGFGGGNASHGLNSICNFIPSTLSNRAFT